MLLLSMLRTGLRYWRGQRPLVEDMDKIAKYMRRRLERGLPAVPGKFTGNLRRFGGSRSAEGLQALQTRKLRRTVEYVYRYVPFYHETLDATGVGPSDIRTLADIHRLPITKREQLSENSDAFVSRYPGLVPVSTVRSSGTTGTPVELYLTNEELQYYGAGEAITGMMMGWLGPAEIMQRHFSTEPAVTGTVMSVAARKAGAMQVVPGKTLDDHVESIFRERVIPGKKRKVSLLMTSPSHLWALTHRAEKMGVDFTESGLQRIQTGGAMVSQDLKQRVLETWGLQLSEGYGLVEVFTCAAGGCGKSDRMHFTDMTGYAEVLDPQTEEPVPAGQPGVLAITSFYPDRELMPLLRYWTEDLVVLSPELTCACGLQTTQILRILGRVDHMVKVGGWNIYPQMVGDSLLAFRELVLPPRFSLRTEQRQDAQYAILDVEARAPLSDADRRSLERCISEKVVYSLYWEVVVGSVKLVVNLRPPGSLEHPFRYKDAELVLATRDD
jgi:phenylacetate-CoA ligase